MTQTKRVITVAPMSPEKSAYALARYSRSPDSIRDSIQWLYGSGFPKSLDVSKAIDKAAGEQRERIRGV